MHNLSRMVPVQPEPWRQKESTRNLRCNGKIAPFILDIPLGEVDCWSFAQGDINGPIDHPDAPYLTKGDRLLVLQARKPNDISMAPNAPYLYSFETGRCVAGFDLPLINHLGLDTLVASEYAEAAIPETWRRPNCVGLWSVEAKVLEETKLHYKCAFPEQYTGCKLLKYVCSYPVRITVSFYVDTATKFDQVKEALQDIRQRCEDRTRGVIQWDMGGLGHHSDGREQQFPEFVRSLSNSWQQTLKEQDEEMASLSHGEYEDKNNGDDFDIII